MQGALELLAIPDVRTLLEEGGLDWKSLRAVATGNVEAGSEVGTCQICQIAESPLPYVRSAFAIEVSAHA